MNMFFGLVGFFGFLVFLVMAIVSLIKKNGKGKRNLIIAIICFVVFAIMASTDSSNSNSKTTSSESKQEKKVEKPKKLGTESDVTALVKVGMPFSEYTKLDDKLNKVSNNIGSISTDTSVAGIEWQAKDGYVVTTTDGNTVVDVKTFKTESEVKAYAEQLKNEQAAAKKAQEEAEAKAAAEKAAQEKAQKKASAQTIDYPHLKKNPDSYKDTYVKYTGQIVQILESNGTTNIRLSVTKESYGYSFNDIIFVEYNGTTDFVENDIVTVYGDITGDYSYTSQAGYDIHIPGMLADEVTK